MKLFFLSVFSLLSFSSYAADLSCFVAGKDEPITSSFVTLTKIEGETDMIKYSILADANSILVMKMTDQQSMLSVNWMTSNSTTKLADLNFESDGVDAFGISCRLK